MANVNAIPDGKEKNVHCVTTNAKWPIAMGMGIVSAENVHASEATKGNYVKKVRIENYWKTMTNPRIEFISNIYIFPFCFRSRLSTSNMFWPRLLR